MSVYHFLRQCTSQHCTAQGKHPLLTSTHSRFSPPTVQAVTPLWASITFCDNAPHSIVQLRGNIRCSLARTHVFHRDPFIQLRIHFGWTISFLVCLHLAILSTCHAIGKCDAMKMTALNRMQWRWQPLYIVQWRCNEYYSPQHNAMDAMKVTALYIMQSMQWRWQPSTECNEDDSLLQNAMKMTALYIMQWMQWRW